MQTKTERWECNLCGLPCRLEIETTDGKMPEWLASQSRFRDRRCPCLETIPSWKRLDVAPPPPPDERVAELEAAVATMSHRKCWNCGNVAYHLLDVIPYVLCEKCGSQDTRLIRKAALAEKGGE